MFDWVLNTPIHLNHKLQAEKKSRDEEVNKTNINKEVILNNKYIYEAEWRNKKDAHQKILKKNFLQSFCRKNKATINSH